MSSFNTKETNNDERFCEEICSNDWTAELSAFYNEPTLWRRTFKTIAMYSIDAGMQKTVFKAKAM